mmetsp:Transcript_21339/g.35247  ORF Transcript_21339/g.35247 Transcript_21339/m.35247 type:complete len:248 (+) Transcript_21339:1951-2694(+)
MTTKGCQRPLGRQLLADCHHLLLDFLHVEILILDPHVHEHHDLSRTTMDQQVLLQVQKRMTKSVCIGGGVLNGVHQEAWSLGDELMTEIWRETPKGVSTRRVLDSPSQIETEIGTEIMINIPSCKAAVVVAEVHMPPMSMGSQASFRQRGERGERRWLLLQRHLLRRTLPDLLWQSKKTWRSTIPQPPRPISSWLQTLPCVRPRLDSTCVLHRLPRLPYHLRLKASKRCLRIHPRARVAKLRPERGS